MCLIAVAWRAHPRYPLILAANRDEFHARVAAPADFWIDAPQVYGGRDLVQGGGWLALSKAGRLAAITNVRRMVPPDPQAPSRGALVADFVRGTLDAHAYAQQLAADASRYAGFNLLLHDGAQMLYVSNLPQFTVQMLTPGVHAVSNAALDTPWPKLLRLKRGLADWVQRDGDDAAPLFDLLGDDRTARDEELPDTGVGLQMERFLSPPFIRGADYGTRCRSVVMLGADGAARFIEQRHAALGVPAGSSDRRFALEPAQA